MHRADAFAATAKAEFNAARLDINSRTPNFSAQAVELGGRTLIPGVYAWDDAAEITANTTLTLDAQGNPDAQWLFQIPSTLTVGSGAAVVIIGPAEAANNVYWAVGSASIGTGATFVGTVLAADTVTMGANASIICGRAVADTASVTLIMNTITICVEGGDDDGGDDDEIPLDELGGEGVSGTEQTAFDASRLFGSTMLAQTVFPVLAVGAPGFGSSGTGPQGNLPEKYTPLKLGPSPVPVGGDFYQPQRWRVWAAGLGGGRSLEGDRGSGILDTTVGGVAGGLGYRFNPTALIGIAGGYPIQTFRSIRCTPTEMFRARISAFMA